MIMKKYCETLAAEYPEYITKEQMCRVCHISKKTCSFLLQSGLVPNIDTQKRTHRYRVRMVDVIHYLKDREKHPLLYKAPDGYYIDGNLKHTKGGYVSLDNVHAIGDIECMRCYYELQITQYPDVMTIEQVAEFTGYCKASVVNWCSKQYLECFFIKQQYKIPKEYLLDFLMSRYFACISVKSTKHRQFMKELTAQSKLKISGVLPMMANETSSAGM